MTPRKALLTAQSDLDQFALHGMKHLAIETTASRLFSHFTGEGSTRAEAVETYSELFDELAKGMGELSFYKPNDYAWSHMDRYLDAPLYSSNYLFVTDTVPFLQIVLKGYKRITARFLIFILIQLRMF